MSAMAELNLDKIGQEIEEDIEELISKAGGKAGQVLVVGCSTSEVLGNKIGTGGSMKLAKILYTTIRKVARKYKIAVAAQCCEHLNRALVVEEKVMEKYGWQQVTVRPIEHAGGAFAATAYNELKNPVVVETIQADLGLDIGQTLIGMHLKRVAVPVRMGRKTLGNAVLTAARTRPPLIGGERAVYK